MVTNELNHLPSNENRGPTVNGLTWAATVGTVMIVALRLYTRLFLRRTAGLDDALMVIALLVNLTTSAFMSIDVHYGLGRHADYLSHAQIAEFRKYMTLGLLLSYIDQFFSRASILVFIMRHTPTSLHWPRRVAWVAIALNLIAALTAEIGFGIQCLPLSGAWNSDAGAKCFSPHYDVKIVYATSSLNIFTDLIAALVPMIVLRDLRVTQGLKISIYVCMGLGLLCAMCSAGKMAQVDFGDDFTWTAVPSELWTVFESKLAIIVGSLPAIRQFYTAMYETSTGTGSETPCYRGTEELGHMSTQQSRTSTHPDLLPANYSRERLSISSRSSMPSSRRQSSKPPDAQFALQEMLELGDNVASVNAK